MVLQWWQGHLSLLQRPLAATGMACSELPGATCRAGVGPSFASWDLCPLAGAGGASRCAGPCLVPLMQGSATGAASVSGATRRCAKNGCRPCQQLS